jgi:hypothetical protein
MKLAKSSHEYFFLSRIWHRNQNRNRNTLPPLGVRPPEPADQAALRGEDIRAAERRGGEVHRQHQAGLEKTRGFKKKKQPSGFFCFFLFFFGVLFFLFFLYICPEERIFRVFSVSRILFGASRR